MAKSVVNPVDSLALLSELESVCKLQSIQLSSEERASTGLLCLDLMLGGGLTAGWYTFAGPEQSAKTTTAITCMASSVTQNIPLRVLWDAENSSGSSGDYVANIFNTMKVPVKQEELFGIKVKGKYAVNPLVYYRDEGEMDTFFSWTAALLRRLPDKRYEDGKWWYVYEGTRENKAKYKGQMDRALSSANEACYIPAEDGSLQAMILVDSLPSLLPSSMDQDEAKAGMALQAREFSKHIPRVKGSLRAKRVAIMAINQLRVAPGVMYGNPNYEPGGAAPKFYSDVRVHNTPRALSGVPFNPKGKGQEEEEPSVEFPGTMDKYRYIHTRAIKNKLSVPNREGWFRIWASDGDQKARGFCPVWDTFYVMYLTGQLSGKRSTIKLNLHGIGEAKKTLTWEEFKTLVLSTDKEVKAAICTKIGYPPLNNLRKGLFKMMSTGKMEELYAAQFKKTTGKDEDSESEDSEADADDEV